MDQLTEKPISVDEIYDKAVAEAKAGKRPYAHKAVKAKPPAVILDETPTSIELPRTAYSPRRKRVAFKESLTQEWQDTINLHIMMGHTLHSISDMPGMPSEGTMEWWIINNPLFKATYARACQYRADRFEDEIIDLASAAANSDNPFEIRGLQLKIDTLKWIMGRSLRKKWGDHVTVDVTPVDLSGMDKEASETFLKLLNQMSQTRTDTRTEPDSTT